MSPITSWIFPGQGSQSVGMGAAALTASPAARAVLAEAEAALGEPLGQLMATGPAEALERTEVAQPAILTISIALLAAARERAAAAGTPLDEPILIAGHSAGQYAAAVAAGALTVADGVRLARRRGELMQASGGGRPGAMAAILGLPESAEADVIAAGAKLGILVFANRNSPGQIVLSGEISAIEAAVAAASAAGAKRAVRLQVSIASHSPLMEEAAAGMRDALAAGASETGTTIHWVDEGIDTGQIIAQERIAIAPADTEESLHERIKIIERGLIVATIPQILAELK